MTDPGFDRVGKIGSDGNPLVRVKHFIHICYVDMSDRVRPGKVDLLFLISHCLNFGAGK